MFTVNKFARQNIYYNKFSSMIFFFVVFISSICLFGSGIITESMKQGIEKTRSRLGADIIVVPAEYGDEAKDALFEGKVCTMYFDSDWQNKLSKIHGVEKTSTQLYMETLSLDCCDTGGIQVIAVDLDTDFIVGAWMKNNGIDQLESNEIVAGASCGLKEKDNIKLFNRDFKVAAVLDETGMGYDSSIFVSFQTADLIISDPDYSDNLGTRKNKASMILIKVNENDDIENVRKNITSRYEESGITVYVVNTLIDRLSKEIKNFSHFCAINDIFIMLLSGISLFALITFNTYQRRRSVGSLLSVGVGKSKIISVFITEYLYLTLSGVVSGIITICIFVFPLHFVIKKMIFVPYRLIDLEKFVLMIIGVIWVNIGILVFASVFSMLKILRSEPALLAKGEVG